VRDDFPALDPKLAGWLTVRGIDDPTVDSAAVLANKLAA
jgi:hypothetical protein